MQIDLNRRLNCLLGVGLLAAALCPVSPAQPPACQKIVLTGEVTARQPWSAPFGQGWVFRLVPLQPGSAGYSGWDLVVDRDPPAGFPDALLVATPPYNSINEHEVATTFGLRAQDAIGWNPRSFHFLTDPAAFRESQKLFQALGATGNRPQPPVPGTPAANAIQRLLKINQTASAGQFRILDARLAPGVSDAASYAEPWALASPKTRHTFEPSSTGSSTPLGELHWLQFSVTLWLPAAWKSPPALHPTSAACSE